MCVYGFLEWKSEGKMSSAWGSKNSQIDHCQVVLLNNCGYWTGVDMGSCCNGAGINCHLKRPMSGYGVLMGCHPSSLDREISMMHKQALCLPLQLPVSPLWFCKSMCIMHSLKSLLNCNVMCSWLSSWKLMAEAWLCLAISKYKPAKYSYKAYWSIWPLINITNL